MNTKHLLLLALLTVALAIAGVAYAHDGGDNDGHDGWSRHGGCRGMQLPEEKRQLLHETMRKTFEKNKYLFGQMHKLHEELHDVLTADTFDRQAFMSINAQIEKTHDRIHKIRTEAFASIASQFTPEEREMLMRHHGHHHGHGGGWHHHDGVGRGDHSMNDGQLLPQRNDPDYPPYPAR